MPMSSSPLSFADVVAIMDRALANGRGILVTRSSMGQVHHLRQRCYEMRKLDRKANSETYEVGHPMYNRSVYDKLIFSPRLTEAEEPCLQIDVSNAEALEASIVEL